MTEVERGWRCAFCGRPGRKTKEHVLAQALWESLPQMPETFAEFEVGVGVNKSGDAFSPMPSDGRNEARKKIVHRITWDVCKPCNSGWMGGLDSRVKPILARLLDAARGGEPVRLAKGEARTLTHWAVKSAFTNELCNAGDKQRDLLVATQAEREALGRGVLPPRTRVWLAYYPNCAEVEIAQGLAHFDRHTPALECETPRRFMGTAFVLGELVVLVYCGEITDFAPLLGPDQLVMAHPYPLGIYPPRASSAEQLRGALMTLGHWAPAHPLPYDAAGVGELIGPRSIRKKSRSAQPEPDKHRAVAAAVFSRYMPDGT